MSAPCLIVQRSCRAPHKGLHPHVFPFPHHNPFFPPSSPDEWGKTRPDGLKARFIKEGKLAFGQVPVLSVDDSLHIVQYVRTSPIALARCRAHCELFLFFSFLSFLVAVQPGARTPRAVSRTFVLVSRPNAQGSSWLILTRLLPPSFYGDLQVPRRSPLYVIQVHPKKIIPSDPNPNPRPCFARPPIRPPARPPGSPALSRLSASTMHPQQRVV